jgi:hypothetical protein
MARKFSIALKLARQLLWALVLVAISVLSATPNLALGDQQTQPAPIQITASGEASGVGNGPSGPTTLNLDAQAYRNSNQWLIIQNTTGSLKIASTTFAITGGQGSISKVGAIAIFADTANGKGQLILQGTASGNTVNFQTPSQLASAAYLTLTGTINNGTQQNANTATNTTTIETTTLYNSTQTLANKTQQVNSTLTSSTVTTQNLTAQVAITTTASNASASWTTTSQNANATESTATIAAATGNGTTPGSAGLSLHRIVIQVVQGHGELCLGSRDLMPVCTASSQSVTVNDGDTVNFAATADDGFVWDHYDGLGSGQAQNFNAVITQDGSAGVYFVASGNGSISTFSAPPTNNVSVSSTTTVSDAPTVGSATVPLQGNATVTVTQYVNQTFTATQTEATSTVTYTVTITASNAAMTQRNATVTANETTTVTTSTSP